ncbi:hypothetical protein L1987_25031 [Smallanthus sonchifolius]|uniref:Uncharacterized protein n=1 Tax=Smallanthus sonchifolius TaxID=185202 RepID=A0ACB9ILD1_9ASTR|nr:hypothetical protein L1987_25031 [Smallanthus sonchifolius]
MKPIQDNIVDGKSTVIRDSTTNQDILGTCDEFDIDVGDIDCDVKTDTVTSAESLTRKLRRLRQGLDLIRELFQNFLATDDYSLKASSGYKQVCAPYHTWAVRTAVFAGMCALPIRDQLLLSLNEIDESTENEMRRYRKASLPVIKYVDNLYTSRVITLDW